MIRRLTSATGIAVAVLALTACQSSSSPKVAAYVGGAQITEDQVTAVVDNAGKLRQNALDQALAKIEAAKKAKDANAADADALAADADASLKAVSAMRVPSREAVVQTLVYGKVCQDLREELKFQVEEVKTADIAAVELVAEDSDYMRERAKTISCLRSVPAKPVTPTETDLREVYDNGVRVGAIATAGGANPFSEVSKQLSADGQLASALGVRQVVVEKAAGEKISVSPRYRALSYPVLSFQAGPAIEIVLGQPADPAVVDGILPPPTVAAEVPN